MLMKAISSDTHGCTGYVKDLLDGRSSSNCLGCALPTSSSPSAVCMHTHLLEYYGNLPALLWMNLWPKSLLLGPVTLCAGKMHCVSVRTMLQKNYVPILLRMSNLNWNWNSTEDKGMWFLTQISHLNSTRASFVSLLLTFLNFLVFSVILTQGN